ncbi:MAG: GDP-mannose 4,6-dehydratase [Candidatus Zixiibacteriota bacterium]
MDKVLLTGAAGFIGFHTAQLLIKRGYEVIGVDNFNDYYDIRLKHWRAENLLEYDNFTLEKGDIENMNFLERIFEKYEFDTIINLAARAGVRASIDDPFVYASTNYIGTLNLLELMRKFGQKKFVLASSSSIYAGHEMPFSENQSVNRPISPYAATKKAAELLSYTYHNLFDFDVSVLRFFTVYGPAGRPDMSYFRFIKAIDEGKPITLYGDGEQGRDFTFVDDIVKGLCESTKNLGFEIINLGGGNNPISINTLIAKIEKIMGKKAKIEKKLFQKTDMKFTWANIDKADDILGWQPKVSLDEGIKRTIEWHKKNKPLLRKIKV